MSKWWLLIVLALLSACSGSEQNRTYYQLPMTTPSVSAAQVTSVAPLLVHDSQRQNKHLLWLQNVTLADFLASSSLVYQTSEVNYVLANSNLWASPLDQQIANSLVTSLNTLLPGWLVSASELSDRQNTLSLNITDFHGRYDGRVIISGEWLLKYQQQIIKRPFYIEVKQQQDGYPSMVKALAQGWQQEVESIAVQLKQL